MTRARPVATALDPIGPAFLGSGRTVATGVAVIAVFVIGFLGWGTFAPLDSATIAPGVIVVESHRKSIQHLEGGIVRDILVKDGQVVRAGEVLIDLDDTQARASLALLQGEADALTAEQNRLFAERDNSEAIAFDPALLDRAADPKVVEAMRGETSTFQSRRETLAKQIDILRARIEQNERAVDGIKAQQTALGRELALSEQEGRMIDELVQKGLDSKTRQLDLRRQAADLAGQLAQAGQKIAQTRVNSGETELQIVNLRDQRLDDVLKELRDVQTRRFDLLEKIQSARDVLLRTAVIAPVDGRVMSLAVHAKGAVIRPGETILEVVPQHDRLEVEAHLRPEDADDVHVGMSAKVNLTAYKQRRLPVITGTVTEVSADRLVDSHTGQAYFNADIEVDRASLQGYPDAKLIPGIPTEVAIQTGTRTLMGYLWEPIESVLRKGMREK